MTNCVTCNWLDATLTALRGELLDEIQLGVGGRNAESYAQQMAELHIQQLSLSAWAEASRQHAWTFHPDRFEKEIGGLPW